MTGFVPAARLADVPPGTGVGVEVEGRAVAVFNVDGTLHAIEDVCTHAGAKLSEGPLEGRRVTCPWHHAVFDVPTGEACGGPAFSDVAVYEVRVEGDQVLVRVPASG